MSAQAQEGSEWKYYACPEVDVDDMRVIQTGLLREDVYLGTVSECVSAMAKNPSVKCFPFEEDFRINMYLKNKKIYDQMGGKNSLIENATVYSSSLVFDVDYLYKEEREQVDFYVFQSPTFCRGGWIDVVMNADGSMFIESRRFEESINYMYITTVPDKRERVLREEPAPVESSNAESKGSRDEVNKLPSNGIYKSVSEVDMYKKVRYSVNSTTSATKEYTSNFIKQAKNFLPNIIDGSYCVSAFDTDILFFRWANKEILEMVSFQDDACAGRKDKRDVMMVLENLSVEYDDRYDYCKKD